MKKQLLFVITGFTFLVGYSQNVTLTTQAEVDAYAGGATVSGILEIGFTGGSDISSLANLSSITFVTSYVYIHENPNLVNLTGLDNLLTVTGDLFLQDGAVTASLVGLEGVDSVNNVYISNNAGLTSLTGLDNLTNIGGYLQVANNATLANLTGLEKLASVGGYLWINDNTSLANFTGLDVLTSVSGLGVINNPILENLTPLSNIPTLNDGISFEGCPLIKDFTDLNVTFLEGAIHIKNTSLTSLDGIPDTFTGLYGYLLIENNDDLFDISALASLETVGSDVDIRENLLLSNLDDLSSLVSVDGALIVLNNTVINSISGLSNLTTVKDRLRIQGNPEITSLNGLESLMNFGGSGLANDGFIQIDDNNKLTDISGMVNISSGDINRLTIRGNSLLSTCEISNICAYLPGVGEISGNAIGCATDVQVQAACVSALSVSDYLLREAVSIYPNPVLDELNILVKMEMNIERIELYSIDGRLIKSQLYELQSMDLSNVSTGIYLLKISSDKGQINARIVKQ